MFSCDINKNNCLKAFLKTDSWVLLKPTSDADGSSCDIQLPVDPHAKFLHNIDTQNICEQ
jgi:hypothetical protein